MTGKKFDDGKPRYDLIPPVALEQLATVLTFGAKKYGANNWQTVPDAQNRYYSAMMRHVEADRGGEVFDEESGLPHLTHALACVTFMLHNTLHKPVLLSTVATEQRPGCKVPPEVEPLLEWLGPSYSVLFLDNADSLSAIVRVPPSDFINVAFTWGDSPEGHVFWAALDKAWRNHVVAAKCSQASLSEDIGMSPDDEAEAEREAFSLTLLKAMFGDSVKIVKIKGGN